MHCTESSQKQLVSSSVCVPYKLDRSLALIGYSTLISFRPGERVKTSASPASHLPYLPPPPSPPPCYLPGLCWTAEGALTLVVPEEILDGVLPFVDIVTMTTFRAVIFLPLRVQLSMKIKSYNVRSVNYLSVERKASSVRVSGGCAALASWFRSKWPSYRWSVGRSVG